MTFSSSVADRPAWRPSRKRRRSASPSLSPTSARRSAGRSSSSRGSSCAIRAPSARDQLRGRALIEAAEGSGARLLLADEPASRSTGRRPSWWPRASGRGRSTARHVLLAPGAHDRPVVFPGWTLPGVLTAGAAQTHRQGPQGDAREAGPLRRERPAGPRVPRAASPLRSERRRRARGGARARACGARRDWREPHAETCRSCATRPAIGSSFCAGACRSGTGGSSSRPRAGSGSSRSSMPRSTPTGASLGGTEESVEVDTLCVGYGFFPSVELLRVAGCRLRYDEDLGGPVAVVDRWQRTSVPGVLAAGDGTGVRGSLRRRGPGATGGDRPRRGRGACGAGPGPPRAASTVPAGAQPDVPRRGRHLRACDTRHGRLPLRGGSARAARPGDRGDAGRQRREGLHARRRWASARGATASGRLRR